MKYHCQISVILLLISVSNLLGQNKTATESFISNEFSNNLTFEQCISGLEFPVEIKNNLCVVTVEYWGFDNKTHIGQIVVSKELRNEIREIFDKIYHLKFPIERVYPIVRYDWSDERSMIENNTSCFNYRNIKGTSKISLHSYGRAIDINPRLNPVLINNKIIAPANGFYNPEIQGTITKNSQIVKLFKSYGWYWGGDWKNKKDFQHFYKPK